MSEQESSAISAVDNESLEYTQSIRKNLVAKFLKDENVHNDVDGCSLLLKTLDGIDKVALGRSKIKASASASAAAAANASLMAEILKQVNPHTGDLKFNASVPTLPTEIKLTDAVPGELEIAPEQLTYERFMES